MKPWSVIAVGVVVGLGGWGLRAAAASDAEDLADLLSDAGMRGSVNQDSEDMSMLEATHELVLSGTFQRMIVTGDGQRLVLRRIGRINIIEGKKYFQESPRLFDIVICDGKQERAVWEGAIIKLRPSTDFIDFHRFYFRVYASDSGAEPTSCNTGAPALWRINGRAFPITAIALIDEGGQGGD